MLTTDVIIAGGGVSGLLIASALSHEYSVLLLEQCDSLPQNKYWLTDHKSLDENPHLKLCVDQCYNLIDFVAYDGLTATVNGRYCLWDTEKLIGQLTEALLCNGVQILAGHRLYSISNESDGIVVRANSKIIRSRLLIDCMGFGSPLVGAKDISTITGYYIVHGREVRVTKDIRPIALDNVGIDKQPIYFELFPTSRGTAHAAVILPSKQHTPGRSLKGELNFILSKSHHCEKISPEPLNKSKTYFGIVPVGRLRTPALDRIIFFGEAGQSNPAASATGLSRMLRTYRGLAGAIEHCLRKNTLRRDQLLEAIPPYITRMNRVFQECLFESLLSFNSDDFRRLIQDLKEYPHDAINDLIFGDFDFNDWKTFRLALDAVLRPHGVLGIHILKSIVRFCSWRRSV